jgi:tetratricopeptide (TPR) repeat protein
MMQHTGTLCAALGLGALTLPATSGQLGTGRPSAEELVQWRVQHQRTVESLELLEGLDQRLDFGDPHTLDSLLRFTEPAPTQDLDALKSELARLETEKLGLEAYLFQRSFGADTDAKMPFPPIAAPTTGLTWSAANRIEEAATARFETAGAAGLVDVRRGLDGETSDDTANEAQATGGIQIPRRFEDLRNERRDVSSRAREANLEVSAGVAPLSQAQSTPEEVFRQARSAYLAERYEVALSQLNTLPPTEDHLYWLGRTLEQLERFDEALAAYERVAATGSGELAKRAAEDADFLRWQRSLSESVERAVSGEPEPAPSANPSPAPTGQGAPSSQGGSRS